MPRSTHDVLEGRRAYRNLVARASADARQRSSPPADFVRLDLLLLRADAEALSELCVRVNREADRRLTRAECGRHLLTRAIRLAGYARATP